MRISDWSSDVCSSDLEDGDVDLAQAIGEPRDERGFGADDDEIDRVRLYEGEQAGDVVGGNDHAFGIRFAPRVARRGIALGGTWPLCQLPRWRRFGSPPRGNQDIHTSPFSSSRRR